MMQIVIPVFNAAVALQACLDSVSRTVPDNQPIILIDDCSTDPAIATILGAFAQREAVNLTANADNLGFVRSVNNAMAEGGANAEADVILLNSDVIVTTGWLEAIQRCADSDPRIATITPFSNNAEICSLPTFCRANPVPLSCDAVADAIHACAPPVYPELPTGVGFCMFVRRRAWDELAGFDETFGQGYGEENDFCRRAVARDWRNVLCDDAYVAHVGGQSFAGLGLAPGGDNLVRLLERHPDYSQIVADFIARDSLAGRRQEIIAEFERQQIVAPAA